ncbi:MAG: class II fructose-bisphosphate aldolase [Dehalococcoidia bacterium]|nr:Fructose-bisphosphate aldolase [Chloroflexota bacterium]MBT9159965.1 Fructose-bisphosphate aldolase [Chloroflexota bacterium]
MPFKDGKELKRAYQRAKRDGYAFVASNIAEPNTLIGLLEGSQERRSDLVLQISFSAASFAGGGKPIPGLRVMAYYIKELARNYQIGAFLNLDHMTKAHRDFIETAIEEDLTSSIMIDASKESFEDNVRISREVAELAHQRGTLVEAELGVIKGVEDEIVSDEAFYTVPAEAVEFVRKTGIDLLAISIGTQHGVSKGKDIKLRLDIAAQVNEALKEHDLEIPLVLHGTSGLLPEQVRRVIGYGICKLNKDTHYQYEFARTAHDFYRDHSQAILPPEGIEISTDDIFGIEGWSPVKNAFDPRVVSQRIRERIKATVIELIDQAGSGGKSLYI